ncbi:hypothetical protein K435DRAFT_906601 [Dendrothele bispora CBS 962.96]|uniref:Uncharacterized protein n=1 Tax=Dendrothele bispora (strain CBS 962.96) TaxID=1314807 RepID=A0A4S8MPG3_DENBC|nr:hypothetical protein K435DRAFT_906601 [Dendrothele bispora CBS 962.96]
MTVSDSTSSTVSKYYRSPGVSPNTNHPEKGTGKSASTSKYYRPSKHASPLSLSEIFRPIPPGLSPDDKKKWITNMWSTARDNGIDVEEFKRRLYSESQRPPRENGRTRDQKDTTTIPEELIQSWCDPDPEPQYAQNFPVPSLPSLPLETMGHFADAQAGREYSASQGLTSELPSSEVTDDTLVSDEALSQFLIQFFQDWNPNNPSFDPDYLNDHSTTPSSSSLQHELEPQPQYYQYQSQQPQTTRSLSLSVSTPTSGTFAYHQLAIPPTETETYTHSGPFAYRSPEELAELLRVKIIPGPKYP